MSQARRSGALVSVVGAALVLVAGLLVGVAYRAATRLPPATTPEGAYTRLAAAVASGAPEAVFPLLEEAAREAIGAARAHRRTARDQVLAAYPEPERSRLASEWEKEALAADAGAAWAAFAEERHLVDRLRRDLSGIARVEPIGEGAVVLETVRGTRYELRRGRDGTWGLALFTPELVAAEERARRDAELVRQAAKDYARGTPSDAKKGSEGRPAE